MKMINCYVKNFFKNQFKKYIFYCDPQDIAVTCASQFVSMKHFLLSPNFDEKLWNKTDGVTGQTPSGCICDDFCVKLRLKTQSCC